MMLRIAAGVWIAALASAAALLAAPAEAAPCALQSSSSTSTTLGLNFIGVEAQPSLNCTVSAPAPNTDPNTFAVYDAQYSGFLLDTPDTGRITVTNGQRIVSGTAQGPLNGDLYFEDYAGKDADGNLNSTISLDLLTASDPSSFFSLDIIDYTELATMSKSDAEDSLDSVGLDQVGLVTHLGATANLLTGQGQPLEGQNEAGVVGGAGSFMLGARGRYNLAEGYSVLGGLSLVNQSPGAQYGGLVGAAAFRYVEPGAGSFRLVGEIGAQAAALSLSFSRSYSYTDSNTLDVVPVTTSGSGTAGLGAIYGKVGALVDVGPAGSLLISASLHQTFLGFASYREPFGPSNFFAADLSGKVQSFTTATVGADWTVALTNDLSLTSSLAVGTTIANTGAQAYVFGGGDVMGTPQSALFAQYGLDLGWEVAADSRVDIFAQGSTGVGIGSHAQIGAGYSLKF